MVRVRVGRCVDGPISVHEAVCEMIEKCRVRWAGSVDAKVIGGIHEASSKEVQPDTICHYPGGLRVISSGEPVGQLEAPACA